HGNWSGTVYGPEGRAAHIIGIFLSRRGAFCGCRWPPRWPSRQGELRCVTEPSSLCREAAGGNMSGGRGHKESGGETPADLRRRAMRVRQLIREMGNDQEAADRLAELA